MVIVKNRKLLKKAGSGKAEAGGRKSEVGIRNCQLGNCNCQSLSKHYMFYSHFSALLTSDL